MRRYTRHTLGAAFTVAALMLAATTTRAGSRALVVGIDDYAQFSSLDRAAADSRQMQTLLQSRLGIAAADIVLMDDRQDGTARFPTGANLRQQVAALCAQSGATDRVVLFISARALVQGRSCYVVPGDGDPQKPETLLPVAWLRDQLAASTAGQAWLILDLAHQAAGELAPDPSAALQAELGAARVATWLMHAPGKRSSTADGVAAWLPALDRALAGQADLLAAGNLDGRVSLAEAQAALATQAQFVGAADRDAAWSTPRPDPAHAAIREARLAARAAAAAAAALPADRREALAALESQALEQLAAGTPAAADASFARLRQMADSLRADAEAQRRQLAAQALAARLAQHAHAMHAAAEAPRPFAAAVAQEQRAKAESARGDLPAAAVAWETTAGLYGTACAAVQEARLATALPADRRETLATHGGDAWTAVQTAMAAARAAAATDPEAALVHYERAAAALPAARQTAAAALLALARQFDTPAGGPTALLFADQLVALAPELADGQALRRRLRSNVGFATGQFHDTQPGIRLVYLPAGSFRMGSPADEFARERDETAHTVTLTRGFFMATTELTQAQFTAIMGADYVPEQGVHPNDRDPGFSGPDLPKVNVTWDDAQLLCARLSKRDGLSYRLPTEAEWEYACRAGAATPYHNGKATLTSQEANIYEAAATLPAAIVKVSSFKANAWGLYDMHGNVWEWCADAYAPYAAADAVDPQGADATPIAADVLTRVQRGGSWYDEAEKARSANRSAGKPKVGAPYIGFRLVLDADSLPR